MKGRALLVDAARAGRHAALVVHHFCIRRAYGIGACLGGAGVYRCVCKGEWRREETVEFKGGLRLGVSMRGACFGCICACTLGDSGVCKEQVRDVDGSEQSCSSPVVVCYWWKWWGS